MIMAFTVIAINAQTATFATNGTYGQYTVVQTLTNTTAKWFQVNGYTDWITSIDFQCHLDSTSGNHTNVAVSLYGRKFSTDSWTAIGSTVNWKGTTADTTITISTTSGSRWREYKLNYVGTGTGTSSVTWQKFKLWYQ